MKRRTLWLAALAIAALVAVGLAQVSRFKPVIVYFPVEEIDRMGKTSGLTDCFWIGNYSQNAGANYAYPDTGANYWVSQFKLPAGARLALDGEFPHARHMSFNSYDVIGQPVDRLNDTMILPVEGSTNPYVVGARRDVMSRAYKISIETANLSAGGSMAERDASRPRNTLFVPQDSDTVQLILRIYVQDKGLTPKAGVELPSPRMTLADGRTVQGAELCNSIVVKEHSLRDIHLTREATKQLLSLESHLTPYHPAQHVPRWTAFFNPQLIFASLLDGTSFSWVKSLITKQRKGGFYSTLDNTYMYVYVDNRLGDVLVLQGRAPTTPKTGNGNPIMQSGQLRYWSVCKYRSMYDTAVDTCVFDELVQLNERGEYTIVYSTPDMRPNNARPECGVTWQAWGVGDGIDNPHGGLLTYRNMMPSADFRQSIFATRSEGDEQQALGAYYPRSSYQAKAAFEARGCPLNG